MPNSNEQFSILPLSNGLFTLRSLTYGETYHPGIGPMAEANILYVDAQKIEERAHAGEPLVIWDVGLGAAANAIAVIEKILSISSTMKSPIEIHSFDRSLEPLKFALKHARELQYLLPHIELLSRLIQKGTVKIHQKIKWQLHVGNFSEWLKRSDDSVPAPTQILYDPYSSSENREMWSLEHFTRLYEKLDPLIPCTLTNYTRSTSMRSTLALAGFCVGVGPRIAEKTETTVAANQMQLLETPLGKDWLLKVKRSHQSAPFRDSDSIRKDSVEQRPISETDFAALASHRQFC